MNFSKGINLCYELKLNIGKVQLPAVLTVTDRKSGEQRRFARIPVAYATEGHKSELDALTGSGINDGINAFYNNDGNYEAVRESWERMRQRVHRTIPETWEEAQNRAYDLGVCIGWNWRNYIVYGQGQNRFFALENRTYGKKKPDLEISSHKLLYNELWDRYHG